MINEAEELEYRADHMTLDELERITAETKFYGNVVNKLLARGSKLIVGPRGVGKTHGEFKHEVRQFEKSYDNQQAEQISLMV